MPALATDAGQYSSPSDRLSTSATIASASRRAMTMSVLFAGLVLMLWDGTVREAGLPGFVVGLVFVI
ncbi:hypothetical protein [Halopiger xanaduensis]|uniref:Uncharacterized protein n=1 Tax=Halopiger xanaduensis (strain DSM 18323 / JCM 14033 / SH-6) TaxID=797210 RepID=F8D7H7_HALXS|nr:hypothetical protein [Halopiger xanaduensis]AEH36153.1 hypothetical protein Halxa_1521 [Halopiger xanaduensis SH-6]